MCCNLFFQNFLTPFELTKISLGNVVCNRMHKVALNRSIAGARYFPIEFPLWGSRSVGSILAPLIIQVQAKTTRAESRLTGLQSELAILSEAALSKLPATTYVFSSAATTASLSDQPSLFVLRLPTSRIRSDTACLLPSSSLYLFFFFYVAAWQYCRW